jgi:hypothetical protein
LKNFAESSLYSSSIVRHRKITAHAVVSASRSPARHSKPTTS